MKRKYEVVNSLKKVPGIYKISCDQTDKVYIGETINLSQRILKHFSMLRKGKHSNPILLNIFNKYGEESLEVSVLQYLETTDELILKTLEQEWQSKFPSCISLDSNVIFCAERTEEWKANQRKTLDIIRDKAIEVCSKSIILYNIKSKECLTFNKIQDAEYLMERKHIDKNINQKIYIPYKDEWVAFYKKEFTEENKSKILVGKSYLGTYLLLNALTGESKSYASKSQFSVGYSGKKNDNLYDYFKDNLLFDFDFTYVLPEMLANKENFLNSYIKLQKTSRSKHVKIRDFYNGLKENKTNIELSTILGISRHTLSDAYKLGRSKEDWIKIIDEVLSRIAT